MTPSEHASPATGADRAAGGVMRWFGRSSTSVKLFLFMLLFLAPLGLIAILAALESARIGQAARVSANRAAAVEGARAVDTLVARNMLLLRAAASALEQNGAAGCRAALTALVAAGGGEGAPALAVYDAAGRRICALGRISPRFAGPAEGIAIVDRGTAALISGRGAAGRLVGIARVTREAFVGVTGAPGETMSGLAIREGDAVMRLRADPADGGAGLLRATAPLAGDAARLELAVPRAGLTATEALSILLPLLMLLAAAGVAFLVTDRMMLRPLRQLQQAVLAYRAGDRTLAIPDFTTPAREIQELAAAFRAVAGTIVRHEHELEEGLARQTKLTREVHHRVKNNLQVVASLINLHARGAGSQDVADAYAAIQRRVDALAVVHRNHYAELEENRGVALRPLVSELATNLRAGAPLEAAAMSITHDLAPLYATQDVAVPVAFLVTELVETAMLRGPAFPVRITLAPTAAGRAMLSVSGVALRSLGEGRSAERVARVLQGLSRQLRTALLHDEDAGRVGIEISVVD